MVPWTAHGRMKSTPGDLGDRSSPSWTAGRSQGFIGNPGRSQFAPWGPGRSQVLLLEAWAIAGFAPGSLGDRRLAPGDSSDRRIPPGLLSGRPLCSVVALYAVWSPLSMVWSPLSLFLCLRSVYEGCTLLPCVNHVCHVIIGYFWV